MVSLTTIWNSKYNRFKIKYNIYNSLILYILTYGGILGYKCFNQKNTGFENKSHRKLFGISYKEMKTTVYIRDIMIS